jgi:hypothetical protein
MPASLHDAGILFLIGQKATTGSTTMDIAHPVALAMSAPLLLREFVEFATMHQGEAERDEIPSSHEDHGSCTMRLLLAAIAVLVLSSPVLVTATSSTERSSLLGGRCELVELQPGYPGYRGYVTGVDGVGDFACLSDLMEDNPSFSRSEENRANRAAARSLGINGGPTAWTWENWMAIEAERGLPPTCYSCLFDPDNLRAEPTIHNVDPDDARLNIGGPFGSSVWYQLQSKLGVSSFPPVTNYYFRALAYSLEPGTYWNAIELLGIYETIYQVVFLENGNPEIETLWCFALSQGGYAPTPRNANMSDQEFMLSVPLYLILIPWLNRFSAEAATNTFEGTVQQWRLDILQGRTTASLATYLRSTMLGDNC